MRYIWNKEFLNAKMFISVAGIFHSTLSSVDWLPLLTHVAQMADKPQSLHELSSQAHTTHWSSVKLVANINACLLMGPYISWEVADLNWLS